jgi:hypothetical protein
LWWHKHFVLHVTPKGSSHKGLDRGTVQATDKTSSPHKTLWREQVIWKCYRHGSSLDCRKMNQRTSLCSRMGLPRVFT